MPILESTGIPLLFLVGEYDMIVPSQAMRTAHEAMPGSQFAEIPTAGHSAYFEQPEAYNAVVLDFLGETYPGLGPSQRGAQRGDPR